MDTLRKLSVSEQSAALDDVIKGRALSPQRVSALQQYLLCMLDLGHSSPLPLTVATVKAYLTWRVFQRKTATHTLGPARDTLRAAARATDTWAVLREDEHFIDSAITLLQRTKPTAAKEREHIPTDKLDSACRRLLAAGTLAAAQRRAILAVGPGTHARGKEMAGKGVGMCFMDLVTSRKGLGFMSRRPKTDKRSLTKRARAYPHLPAHLAAICPASALTAYKEALAASGYPTGPKDHVWIQLTDDRAQRLRPLPLTVANTTSMAREELAKEGVPRSAVDAHWARYVGTATLEFELDLDPKVANMLGDWAHPASRTSQSTREKTYVAPALASVEWLMNLAQKHARKKGRQLCCAPAPLPAATATVMPPPPPRRSGRKRRLSVKE